MLAASPPIRLPSGSAIAKLALHVAAFVATECLLNVAGLDTLADYYEFLNGERAIAVINHSLFTANAGLLDVNLSIDSRLLHLDSRCT
jgi:hypothetical protein